MSDFIIVIITLGIILWIGIAFWKYIMIIGAILILITVILAIIGYNLDKRDSDKRSKRAEQKRIERTKKRQNQINKVAEYDFIIIDTNIWLSEKCNLIFNILEESDVKVLIPREVYLELKNKRNSNYDKESYLGRMGIRRLENLSKNNNTIIKDINIKFLDNSYVRDLNRYADPKIIETLLNEENNGDYLIITDDLDLKIVGRQIMRKHEYNNTTFVSRKEFKEMLNNIS
jgi:uncharacterized protein YacL